MQQEISHKQGQSLYDIAIIMYGSIDYLYKVISDNEGVITNADFDFEANPNTTLVYDDDYVLDKVPTPLNQKSQVNSSSIETIKAIGAQTIFDIALMTYGNMDLIYKLITDSGLNSNVFKGNLIGLSFNFDKNKVKNVLYANNLKNSGYIIATGDYNSSGKSFDKSFDKSFN